jgi:hypothetical protein
MAQSEWKTVNVPQLCEQCAFNDKSHPEDPLLTQQWHLTRRWHIR